MIKQTEGSIEIKNPVTGDTKRIAATKHDADIPNSFNLTYNADLKFGWEVVEDSFEEGDFE